MGKPIELTWRNPQGKIVVEYCMLVADDDEIGLVGVGEPIGKTISDIANGNVMFEDGEGVFAVPPKDVINIRHLR